MPEYILNRNYVLRSPLGHSVSFKKNEPTFVPKLIEREALQIGAERIDGQGDAPNILPDEEVVIPPLAPQERSEQLFAAFDILVESNEPKDFTGAGVPTVTAVKKIVDFDVDRVEIASNWAEYKQR